MLHKRSQSVSQSVSQFIETLRVLRKVKAEVATDTASHQTGALSRCDLDSLPTLRIDGRQSFASSLSRKVETFFTYARSNVPTASHEVGSLLAREPLFCIPPRGVVPSVPISVVAVDARHGGVRVGQQLECHHFTSSNSSDATRYGGEHVGQQLEH
jgi:hypothetical protein